MNLSEMTREQLWALDDRRVRELCLKHGIATVTIWSSSKTGNPRPLGKEYLLSILEQHRLELQQTAAESRQDSTNER